MYLSPSVWVVLHCLLHKHPSHPQGPRHTRRCRGCVAHSRTLYLYLLYLHLKCICIFSSLVELAFTFPVFHDGYLRINIHCCGHAQIKCFFDQCSLHAIYRHNKNDLWRKEKEKKLHLNFSQRVWHQGSWLLNLKNCNYHRNPQVSGHEVRNNRI